MGKPHTIIGAMSFHFRVRDGIGWYQHAMAARQTVGVAPVGTTRIRLDRLSLLSMRLLEPNPKHLGVIWSSLTGN